MIKFNSLLLTTAILSVIICEEAKATIKTGTDCNGNCTWYYDSEKESLTIKPNEGASGDLILTNSYCRVGIKGTIKDVVIEEGITGVGGLVFWNDGLGNTQVGTKQGKITFPSTINEMSWYYSAIHNSSFGTIDLSKVTEVDKVNILQTTESTLILSESSNLKATIGVAYSGQTLPENINVACKGRKENCIKNVNAPATTNITADYYVGDDGNGNWEEWSDNGKAVYTDSTKEKLISKYDFDGNQTGSYKYDGAGNLVEAYENGKLVYAKQIYTPAEAAAAVKATGNVVSITW